MCVDMGGGVHTFGKGGSQGVHEEGVHRGFTKRGVHVNPVNPPGYGPGPCGYLMDLSAPSVVYCGSSHPFWNATN